jgi:NAD(P)-dependent dehydrogenase (short-subunit alcohol dehydrogenase family)
VAKVWFITGTSKGFGREWTIAALERGDRVAATARDTATLADLTGKYGDAILPIELDVNDRAADFAAVARAHEHFGRLDVVVNNAGYGHFGFVEEITEAEARAQLETNLLGPWRVCRAVLPAMRAQAGGLIVNIGSIGGLTGIPFQAAYSASKFGLEGLTEALRLEVRPFGIRVVVVEPGNIDTQATARSPRTGAGSGAYDHDLERAREAMVRSEAGGAPPEAVARLLARVMATPRPRVRYTVGPVPERAAASVKRVLPSRLFERLLLPAYGLDARRLGGTGVES